jgi:hypothetical protein
MRGFESVNHQGDFDRSQALTRLLLKNSQKALYLLGC